MVYSPYSRKNKCGCYTDAIFLLQLKTQAPSKHPVTVTPAQRQVYLSSVYGRQPYYPQRTTSKAPYLHYQSPVNPKTAAIMAGLMAGDRGTTSKPVLPDVTSIPEKEVVASRKKKTDAARPLSSLHGQPSMPKDNTQYYFHPRVDLPHFSLEEGRVAVPLEGQLVAMAIPLGKPKTDPALRPPIVTKDMESTSHIEGNGYHAINSLLLFSIGYIISKKLAPEGC